MSYLRAQVFVLKKEPFREHDRLYFLYGREHGLLTVVARGSSLSHSKQAGVLEPFSSIDVMIAQGQAFDKLAVAKNTEPAMGFKTLAAYIIMGALCNLVISLLRSGISDERVFHLLCETRRVCAGLASEPTSVRARIVFNGAALKLLDLLGFGPALSDSLDLPAESITLIKFIRSFPLTDVPRVTAETSVFDAASRFVENALSYTPLEAPPHGPATIRAIL